MRRAFLFLIFLNVLLAGCINAETKINNAIGDANYCETKDDCKLIGSKCPFGCYIYVNGVEAGRISKLVDSYESRCIYQCIQCTDVACVDNKCQAVCDK